MIRSKVISSILGVAAVLAFAAWLIGSRIESPADAAARTEPPVPSAILVPIEMRELSSNIVSRGKARFGLPQPVTIPPSGLKSGPGLVTSLPLRNTMVGAGAVLLTASGRPVFVLEGKIPAFRDLSPGMTGDDVLQLERGLKKLGFDPGRVDGVFDLLTSAAVTKWYKSKGWEPFGATKEQLASLYALEREWAEATKILPAADVVGSGSQPDTVQTSAERSESAALPKNETKVSMLEKMRAAPGKFPLTVEVERAKADHSNKAAAADVAALIAERALIVLDPRQPETARAAINAKLEVARASVVKIELEGELAVQAAEREARLAATRSHRIRAELDLARGKLGAQIPADELVFIPILPVRVEEVTAKIGAAAIGSVMSVTNTQLVVDSALTLETSPLVKPGMQVVLDEQALGIKASGFVEMVASSPGTNGVDGYHVYFEVRVVETSGKLEGTSLRMTIPIKASSGSVMAVPLSAVSLAADGTTRIQVQNKDVLEYVVVTPGLAVDGYVEITPVSGKLAPGQLVVVGYNAPENNQAGAKKSQ